MNAEAHRSEAERTLLDLAQRARLGFALGTIGLVAVARQLGAIPDDLLVRAVAVAGVLLAGVAAQEVTTRVGRLPVRFALGVVGDVVAASLAVVLLADRAALVPAVLLWPIFSGGSLTRQLPRRKSFELRMRKSLHMTRRFPTAFSSASWRFKRTYRMRFGSSRALQGRAALYNSFAKKSSSHSTPSERSWKWRLAN